MVLAGNVAVEHRHPRGGIVPTPLIDAEEEHPQRAEPVRDRRRGDPVPVLAGTGREPWLVALDLGPADPRNTLDVGVLGDQERRQRAQSEVGVRHAAGP